MTAADLRPWIFWIVCGVIVLALLIVAAVIEPSRETAPKGTAAQLKKQVDAKMATELSELRRRARNPEPHRRQYSVESEADQKFLTNDIILPLAWAEPLKAQVQLYDQQLARFDGHLRARSQFLAQPVGGQVALSSQWYDDYMAVSTPILAAARSRGLIAAEGDLSVSPLRTGLGLELRPTTYEGGTEEQRKRTAEGFVRQLRMAQHILETLAEARGQVVANPISSGAVEIAPGPVVARVDGIGWTWGEDQPGVPPRTTELKLAGSLEGRGRYHQAQVRLRGPVAALTAAASALERSPREDRPMVVLVGLAIDALEKFPAGARRTVASEDALATLRLAVLDFVETKQP